MKSIHLARVKRRARAKRVKAVRLKLTRNLTLLTLFLAVTLSFFLQLILANNLSTKGGEIKELEQKKGKLVYKISLLENERDKLSSLARVRNEAQEKLNMDFDAAKFDYLKDLNVAYKE